MSARARRVAVAGVLVAGVALAAAALGPRRSEPANVAAGADDLPPPVAPAFRPGAPEPLGSRRHLAYWAPVRHATVARAAPDAAAPVLALLGTSTPERTRNAVAVLARRADAAGRLWVRVRLPVLPNGTIGWVRRSTLGGYQTVRTHLVVELARLRATLYRNGRPRLRAEIGAGMPGWDTPRGEFYVRNRLTRYRSPTYGPIAFGISARSPRATDWPAGGFVGIHGTDRPDLIPGLVSHGCIRLRNRDIVALARLMPVGTPVTIR